jgi:hypothetical protein
LAFFEVYFWLVRKREKEKGEGGGQLNGNGWNGLKDVLGIAIGQNFAEKDFI